MAVASTLRLRTLDALHLAIALDLQKSGRIDVLVSADTAMVTVAKAEGLAVSNPLDSR